MKTKLLLQLRQMRGQLKLKRLPRVGLGLLLVALFASQASNLISIPIIDRLDGILYDLRLRLDAPGGVDPRIVIVDIDEASLREREKGGEGRWPWPRDRLALLNNQLFDKYNAALVSYDVIFSERDESSGIKTIDALAQKELKGDASFQSQYQRLKPLLDYDERFAKSLQDRPVILGYTFLSYGDTQGSLPPPVLTTQELPLSSVDPMQRQGYTADLGSLQRQASDGGHINPIIDADGILRRVPMLVEFEGGYYESLSLASARTLLGGMPLQLLANSQQELVGLDVGGASVPVDSQLTSYIPYRGPYKSFEYLSAAEVIQGKVPKEKLDGKIVLIGTTAPGLLDLRATPVGKAYPGVEIHANLIAGILDGTIKQSPTWGVMANLALILVVGVALALALPLLSPLLGSIVSLTTILAIIALNYYSYLKGYVLPLAALVVGLLLIYILNLAYGYFVESRGKRLMTGLFGQYVPPELVNEMAQDPSNFSMVGESRELTILFSDVRGFTTISESLDAKTLSDFINAFLTPFTKVIYNHRGTIDKYMGDCIMAFWGAPIRDEQHARQGVLSAFEMLKAMELLNIEFVKKGWPPIKVGIGLNSGRVSVGNMGSEIRLAYTVMGDAVNLASRLESITKEYGVAIIIGEETRRQLPDLIARELDKVKVKGKDIAVTIYEPLGFEGAVDASTLKALALFESALKAYRAQQWDSAQSQFEFLLENHADKGVVLYELYLERITHLRVNPPGEDWDGSFTFTKK